MIRTLTLLPFLFAGLTASAVTVTVSVAHERCGNGQGSVAAVPSGGVPPYTYSWSTGTTTQVVTGLSAGIYTVMVTDNLGGTAEASGTVEDLLQLQTVGVLTLRADCDNACLAWGQTDLDATQGTAPYTVDFPNPQFQGTTVTLAGLCAGFTNIIQITDANGCPGTIEADVFGSTTIQLEPQAVIPSCVTDPNGTITVPGFGGEAWYRVQGDGYDEVHHFSAPPYVIGGLAAGEYLVELWDLSFNAPVYCTAGATIDVPELPAPCGGVSGQVFHDADPDCLFNGMDLPLPYRIITIEPGPAYAITDGDGRYMTALGIGSYTLTQTLLDEVQRCPSVWPVPFELTELAPNATVDLADSSTVPHDLVVSLWGGNARPGFPTLAWITVRNTSAYPSGAVDLTLTYDPLLLSPSTSAWSVGVIEPYGWRMFGFEAIVPPDINLLGQQLSYSVEAVNATSEVNTANNVAVHEVTVTGSYDPNDKQAKTSSGLDEDGWVLGQDEWIAYNIRFQNTGTAAAETVVVRDTIDTDLDLATLELIGSSHAFTPSLGHERDLAFTFENIMLPDSTTDLAGSQGYVSFRIRPNPNILIGDVLMNTAAIYFDFNPPIITNTVRHTVEISTSVQAQGQGQVTLFPNPAQDVINVTLPHGATVIELAGTDGRTISAPMQRTGDTAQLLVRDLAPGIYILRARHAGGTSIARFVKN